MPAPSAENVTKPNKALKRVTLEDGAEKSGAAIKAQTTEGAYRADLAKDALARYSVINRAVLIQYEGAPKGTVKRGRSSRKQ